MQHTKDFWGCTKRIFSCYPIPITSSNYGTPLEGEFWDVETHYMIDYVVPTAE